MHIAVTVFDLQSQYNLCHLFTFMTEEKKLTEQGYCAGENCYAKKRHLFDFQSHLPWVMGFETPSGLFSFFSL